MKSLNSVTNCGRSADTSVSKCGLFHYIPLTCSNLNLHILHRILSFFCTLHNIIIFIMFIYYLFNY